jgi:hypothetical protein
VFFFFFSADKVLDQVSPCEGDGCCKGHRWCQGRRNWEIYIYITGLNSALLCLYMRFFFEAWAYYAFLLRFFYFFGGCCVHFDVLSFFFWYFKQQTVRDATFLYFFRFKSGFDLNPLRPFFSIDQTVSLYFLYEKKRGLQFFFKMLGCTKKMTALTNKKSDRTTTCHCQLINCQLYNCLIVNWFIVDCIIV